MRSGVLLLAALLSVAAAPEGQRFDAAAALRSVLPAEQSAALSGQSDLNALAAALTPEQRAAAGSKLREAEQRTRDPRDLAAIHKGYLALKDADGAGRVGDAVVERYPQASTGYVMRGQAAELRGDMSGAVEQAQEALRRDPQDRAAFALLKLSEGRMSTHGATQAPPPNEIDFSQSSGLSDPRLVEAGNRASNRAQALKFLDQAMTRLRVKDADEALRLLAQADVLDGTIPDVPMQMGLANREMNRHASAVGHFGRAEQMWRERGGERDLQLADMALRLKQDSEDRLALRRHDEAGSEGRRSGLPLAPLAAGGLGIVAFGVYRSRRARESEDGSDPSPAVSEDQARENYMKSAVYVGVPAAILLTALAGPMIVARAVPMGSAIIRNSTSLTQRIVASEAGMVGPGKLNVDASKIWTATRNRTALENAANHFAEHGHHFPELNSFEAYLAAARSFVMQPPRGTLIKMRGSDRIFYNPAMNTFAVQARDGRIRTMFKPSPAEHGRATNLDYFYAQR